MPAALPEFVAFGAEATEEVAEQEDGMVVVDDVAEAAEEAAAEEAAELPAEGEEQEEVLVVEEQEEGCVALDVDGEAALDAEGEAPEALAAEAAEGEEALAADAAPAPEEAEAIEEEAPLESEVQEEEDGGLQPMAIDEAGMAADSAADAMAMQECAAEEPQDEAMSAPPYKGKKGKGKEKGKGGRDKGKGKDGKGKDGKGKDGKGKEGKGKDGKGKEGGKGGRKGKDKGEPSTGAAAAEGEGGETFYGLIYQAGAKTGNMLIKSWRASQKFGQEVMIPSKLNLSGAVVGDKISFQVTQGREGGRAIAVNVVVRGHIDQIVDRPDIKEGSQEDIRRQVLYYFSDDNLRQDKFFQNIMASTEGGWISVATILGCPRMERMGATCQAVLDAVRDAPDVELREGPPGEEAIRRKSPAPPLEGAAAEGGQAAGAAAGGDSEAAAAGQRPPAAGGPSSAELFYAGMVKAKRGWKFFVQCEAVSTAFGGKDAWFDPRQKPEGVDAGSLVVFTLPPNSDVAFAPKANFVARLAPVGSLSQPITEIVHENASKVPGVQKTIMKRKASWN